MVIYGTLGSFKQFEMLANQNVDASSFVFYGVMQKMKSCAKYYKDQFSTILAYILSW